jgi:hypothetical protein
VIRDWPPNEGFDQDVSKALAVRLTAPRSSTPRHDEVREVLIDMTVTLYLRNPAPAPQMPAEISSVFNTQDEAVAQAVDDIHQDNRAWSPVRIEDETGAILADRAALEKAAAKAA